MGELPKMNHKDIKNALDVLAQLPGADGIYDLVMQLSVENEALRAALGYIDTETAPQSAVDVAQSALTQPPLSTVILRMRDISVGNWKPIETAPHDGTVIELLGENGKLDTGEWCEWGEHFDKTSNEIAEDVTGEFSTECGEGPHTHWRPIASNAGIAEAAESSTSYNLSGAE